jgi:hypothetical protein
LGSIWSRITSGVGGRCTIGDILDQLEHETRKPPRVGRLRKKRKGAILDRRPVPAVPKSHDLAGASDGLGSQHRMHASEAAQSTQALFDRGFPHKPAGTARQISSGRIAEVVLDPGSALYDTFEIAS